MSTITCPVPGCHETWDATLPEAVLTRLMDGHAAHVHPITPTGPCTMPTAQAEKVRRPSIAQCITAEDPNPCLYCGRRGHPSLRNVHVQSCPAYGHTCKKYQKRLHFENVCRSQGAQAHASPIAYETLNGDSGAIFHTLCKY